MKRTLHCLNITYQVTITPIVTSASYHVCSVWHQNATTSEFAYISYVQYVVIDKSIKQCHTHLRLSLP